MAKNGNKNLGDAKKNKNDEFYTQLSDIENELMHYRQHFKDKVVFCNCDDPYESNFFKYFALNFKALGLKKLITTGYYTSPIAGKEITLFDDVADIRQPYAIYINNTDDITEDMQIHSIADVALLLKNKHNTRRKLFGDDKYPAGDFRSEESITLLKQADIVVTNPPFSLFREYVAQLVEYKKSFLILGNTNAVTYKEIFPMIKDNKMWIGNKSMGSDMLFIVSDKYAGELVANKKKGSGYRIVDGKVRGRTQAIWYTNLDVKKRHEELVLWQKYNSDKYPKYDNYDAINVDKVQDIPCDYDGVMGVPITFLDKYNPDQFVILEGSNRYGILNTWGKNEDIRTAHSHGNNINGKAKYFRIHIKRKSAVL